MMYFGVTLRTRGQLGSQENIDPERMTAEASAGRQGADTATAHCHTVQRWPSAGMPCLAMNKEGSASWAYKHVRYAFVLYPRNPKTSTSLTLRLDRRSPSSTHVTVSSGLMLGRNAEGRHSHAHIRPCERGGASSPPRLDDDAHDRGVETDGADFMSTISTASLKTCLFSTKADGRP